jgi:hypothetical protein
MTSSPSLSDSLRDWIVEHNDEALLADGFEDAIVGMAERCSKPSLVVYDAERCIQILVERDGMDPTRPRELFRSTRWRLRVRTRHCSVACSCS